MLSFLRPTIPIVFTIVLAFPALAQSAPGQTKGNDPNTRIKLVYIWTFTSNIRPEHADPDRKEYIVCYQGKDSSFFLEVKRVLDSRKVEFTKQAKVLWNPSLEHQLAADMVILDVQNQTDLLAKLQPLKQASVVTISMLDHLAESKAAINLFFDGHKQMFCINKEVCDANKLMVTDQLINLSTCKMSK